MVEGIKVIRKKPTFLRSDWHKKIKLGSTVKKNRKWKGAKGRHNKIRLNRKGHSGRPRIGWGSVVKERNMIKGFNVVMVLNLKDFEGLKKTDGIIIGKVGAKKRESLISKAKELKIEILNRYRAPLGVPQKAKKGGKTE
ncbi:MAG: 50S ribosomal protein L32e [Nanoarchaeota archaeon]|nr:50S ribosomal protein L32e [Nanoarchaeota archaeon]